MTIKELRQLTGLSQKAFSDKYGIPLRTIENWEGTSASHREPPQYVTDLLEFRIKNENNSRAKVF